MSFNLKWVIYIYLSNIIYLKYLILFSDFAIYVWFLENSRENDGQRKEEKIEGEKK